MWRKHLMWRLREVKVNCLRKGQSQDLKPSLDWLQGPCSCCWILPSIICMMICQLCVWNWASNGGFLDKGISDTYLGRLLLSEVTDRRQRKAHHSPNQIPVFYFPHTYSDLEAAHEKIGPCLPCLCIPGTYTVHFFLINLGFCFCCYN